MLIKKNTGNFCYKPRFTMFKSLIIASLALSTSHLKAETDSDTHSEFHYQHHKHHAHKKHRSGIAFEDVSHLLDFERVDDLLTVPIADRIGGVAWLDYDNDDDLDLFIANAPGGNNALFRNDKGKFVDVAVDAGITGDKSGFTGALAGDINNDGWIDLFLTGANGFMGLGRPSRLYQNNGDGTFTDTTATSGIVPNHLAAMAVFGDIDGDKYLDLFVASPGNFTLRTLTEQKLYHNNGDGTFTDISASAGINTSLGGCVAAFSDFNHDLRPDILVGNCGNLSNLDNPDPRTHRPIPGPWELWINQGDNTFIDHADAAGLNIRPALPMAITAADFDLDGDLDWFATGMGLNNPFVPGLLGEQVLFNSFNDETFGDATYSSGLGGYEWGWGASFADFDNDGDEDLATVGSFVTSLVILPTALANPGFIFENNGKGKFKEIINLGLQDQATSGLAVADYDNDGDTDLVIIKAAYNGTNILGEAVQGDGVPVLLRNKGNKNRSLTVRLTGTNSNPTAIGARVTVHARKMKPQVRELFAGSSFVSTNSPWLTFGLGKHRHAVIVVQWPSGLKEAFWGRASKKIKDLREGTGYPL